MSTKKDEENSLTEVYLMEHAWCGSIAGKSIKQIVDWEREKLWPA